ncbi:type II secretion system minor pseudopilin GspK [Celerinatantimonas yamalensis]|uniref:Type II secretion system protein K n=1 Tax=Celerinatantimonas yamalensis TaxID=559956 RepID=A0ABW9G7P7_9GAMM
MISLARQQGVALLMVLLIITMMVILASRMSLQMGLDIQQVSEVKAQSDNWQRLLSGEQLALAVLQDVMKQHQTLNLSQEWARSITLPISGGQIHGRIVDSSRCFNLNSLRQPDDANHQSMVQTLLYRLLLVEQVSASEARAIAAATRDWVDADKTPLSYGGEDSSYQKAGFRPANQMMVSVSQWREVKGVSAAIYRRVSPLLCALPSERLRIDINTLEKSQVALLQMLFYGNLNQAQALRVLARRPSKGYSSVSTIMSYPELAHLKTDTGIIKVMALTSRYFMVKMTARSQDGSESQLSSLVVRQGTDKFQVTRRILGDWH